MPQRLALIDANSLLHRAYHALPPLTTTKGEQVGAVFGFASMLLKVLQKLQPILVAVAWDSKEPTFRHKQYTQYKAHRPETDKDLINQFARAREVVSAFNIPQFEVPGYEADDIIGTLASQSSERRKEKGKRKKELETIIVTGDLDALQLVDGKTKVFTPRRGFSDTVFYDIDAVKERYGLMPAQIVDYKALRGDPSDNIPGVKGIGEKTAAELLQKYKNLGEVYKHLDELSARQRKLLSEGQVEALLSQKLAEIERQVPIKINLEKCKLAVYDRQKVLQLFQELEFRSLIGKLPESEGKTQERLFGEPTSPQEKTGFQNFRTSDLEVDYQLVDSSAKFDKLMEILRENNEVCLDTETTNIDAHKAKLVGLAVAVSPHKAYYIPVEHIMTDKLISCLADKLIIAHNLKYDACVLKNAGINLNLENAFDTMLAAYLLQAGQGKLNLKELAFSHLGMVIPELIKILSAQAGAKEKSRKGFVDWSKVPIEALKNYACADADATLQLKQKFEQELAQSKNAKLAKLFYEMEMPLLSILMEMEKNGVLIDKKFLGSLSLQLQDEIAKLEKEVFAGIGHEFNLNSSQQLGQVLFDELSLPVVKRTKTQRSTDESVLKKLRGLHPVIRMILRYRELFKVKTGFVDPLPDMCDEKGRVHTTFNQQRTTTGRLSSENPNLQNIPVDPKIGLRRAFVAPQGSKILVADYSQVELRVIAHFSRDSALVSSFEKDQDIHIATAARIFDCFIDEVTFEQRRIAKTMNFAVMYGMSAHGLAQALEIEYIKAQKHIDEYFESYSGMKAWIDETIKQVHLQGFVETLLGRRRLIPEIGSHNTRLRWAGERMAINMPIQGTAADLIKLAMVKISEKLKMVLQVHDELVFEVPEEEVEEVARLVKKEMEGAMELRVPLKVDLKVGNNWGELRSVIL